MTRNEAQSLYADLIKRRELSHVAMAKAAKCEPEQLRQFKRNGSLGVETLARLIAEMESRGFTQRDAFGTIMANDIGLPLPELQILMGHTDIKTTMQYVRARGARTWLDTYDREIMGTKP